MKTRKVLYRVEIRMCESNKLVRALGGYETEAQANKEAEEHLNKFFSARDLKHIEYIVRKVVVRI